MKYKQFIDKLTYIDVTLDAVNKDDVEVSCNKILEIPVLVFKENDAVIDVVVLR